MKCARCNSENIQMQVKDGKGFPIIGFVLLFGGIGLIIFSIIGLAIGALLGLLVGAVIKAILPKPKETVAVCQDCGYTSAPIRQDLVTQASNTLFCTEGEGNFSITRKSSSTGSAILLLIKIDNNKSFTISNGMTLHLKLDEGPHQISYEQSGGLGKKKRTGTTEIDITPNSKHHLTLTFTPTGLDIVKS